MMTALQICRFIDAVSDRLGRLVKWAVLLSVLVSAANATARYALNTGSNAWLELQWYLYAAVFLIAASYTLLHNEHVRLDIFFARYSARAKAWVDLCGGLLCLLPLTIMMTVLSLPMVIDSYIHHEMSSNAGGLLRWPVKILIPIGFGLLTLQGISETVKRAAFLTGHGPDPLARKSSSPDGEAAG